MSWRPVASRKGSIVNREQSREVPGSSRGNSAVSVSTRDLFVRLFFVFWRWYHLSLRGTRGLFLRSVRRRVRPGLMTLRRCWSPTRESAIRYHSKLDFRFTRRIPCRLNRNVKCVRMLVGAIDGDWRDNLDIKSLQHLSIANDVWRKRYVIYTYIYDINNI